MTTQLIQKGFKIQHQFEQNKANTYEIFPTERFLVLNSAASFAAISAALSSSYII
jgi:hypothetical protein